MWKRQFRTPRRALILVLVALTLMAWALRVRTLFAAGLHADEALFASWARLIATLRDPLLSGEPVDKPPLLFYVQAVFYPLLGTASSWVACLPNLAASVLLAPLTARLVWNLYGDWLATVIAAIVVTLSPLLVQYSSSAFLDPLLTALLLASLVAVTGGSTKWGSHATRGWGTSRTIYGGALHTEGRAMVVGLILGAAIITKYQAILFVPLHVVLAATNGIARRLWRWWLGGLVVPLAGVAAWQLARGAEVGLWAQQMNAFGGLRLAWSWELWTRLEAWAGLWGTMVGAPVLAFGLVLFTPVFLALLIQEQNWETAHDQLFLLFLLCYGLLHWFLAVPVWDRYLLPAAPLVALLLGRFVSRLLHFVQPALPLPARAAAGGVALGVLVLMTPAGVTAGDASAGTGSSSQAAGGAAHIAAELQDARYGTVLYDHWYSWHWHYYLADSGVYVSWFAHPATLVADLDVFLSYDEPRYLVLPGDQRAVPVQRALRDAGYGLEVVRSVPEMTLYRISR